MIRIRLYHYRRYTSSIAIQTLIRVFLGKCTVYHRRRHCRGMVLQCMVRVFLAKRRRLHRQRQCMCIRIQCLLRCFLGKMYPVTQHVIYSLTHPLTHLINTLYQHPINPHLVNAPLTLAYKRQHTKRCQHIH